MTPASPSKETIMSEKRVKRKKAMAISEDQIDRMVAAMVEQSTAYPVVPPGYEGRVEALHPFTARQCLLAALRVLEPPHV